MKKVKFWAFILSVPILISCGEINAENEVVEKSEIREALYKPSNDVKDRALSKEERDALKPDDVIAEFRQGNKMFIKNKLTIRDSKTRISQTGAAQFPKAMVLSCIDSRVPVELIFDQGLGDIFVGRVAGNFADEEMLGGMEFATKVAGSKVIMVMGHQNCGAVMSAIDGVELGNITALLSHVKPAVAMTSNFPQEQQTSKNGKFVEKVVKNNVLHTLDHIRSNSAIVAEMEQKGDIKLVGAVYDVNTGEVEVLDEPGKY